MKDVKVIIKNNLIALRKKNNLTQAELANLINFSDKSISRWEKGEVTPDVETLYKLSQIYNVDFSAMVTETPQEKSKQEELILTINKSVILSLIIVAIFGIATTLYLYANFAQGVHYWQLFVWACPVSSSVAYIFSIFWGKKFHRYILISASIWLTLVAIYVQVLSLNVYPIFIAAAPIQIAIILFANLTTRKPKKQKQSKEIENLKEN